MKASQRFTEFVEAAIRFDGDEDGFRGWLMDRERTEEAERMAEAKTREAEIQMRRAEALDAEALEDVAARARRVASPTGTVRIADLTSDQRRLVLALIAAARENAATPPERASVKAAAS
jgi:hypothetical protein